VTLKFYHNILMLKLHGKQICTDKHIFLDIIIFSIISTITKSKISFASLGRYKTGEKVSLCVFELFFVFIQMVQPKFVSYRPKNPVYFPKGPKPKSINWCFN
jgi:hypothetical protein